MARKTITVADLVAKTNRMIAASKENIPHDTEGRLALCTLIESVLHDTGNYRGFQYLDGHEAVIAGDYDGSARRYH